MATKLHRWLDLIAYLAGRRRPVPVEDVMEGVPSYAERWRDADARGRAAVRRMFERDKDELRALDIPIETVSGSTAGTAEGAGYRLARRDFYLPYLRLLDDAAGREDPAGSDATERNATDGIDAGRSRSGRGSTGRTSGGTHAPSETFEIAGDEAGAAVEGLLHLSDLPDFPLVREARTAYRKLTFDLDPSRFEIAPVMVLPPAGERVAKVADILTDALLLRKRVKFDYHGLRRDEVTRREVAPYGLLFERGQWYLVGHAVFRGEVRVFRLSRMSEVVARDARSRGGEFEVPEDFDLTAWTGREAWELGWENEQPPTIVLTRFDALRSLWADRNRFGRPVERFEDGATLRDFQVRDAEPFVRWILGMDGEAEVESPVSLRDEVRRAADRLVHMHGSKGGDA